PLPLQIAGVPLERIPQLECREAGTLGVVLVRDRGAEERHDAVTGVLIDGPFEAMDAVAQDGEKPFHYLVPRLGVDALGHFHRTLHVGEQHRDALPLALEGTPRAEDLLGEVLRRVGGDRALRGGAHIAERSPALPTELGARPVAGTARR